MAVLIHFTSTFKTNVIINVICTQFFGQLTLHKRLAHRVTAMNMAFPVCSFTTEIICISIPRGVTEALNIPCLPTYMLSYGVFPDSLNNCLWGFFPLRCHSWVHAGRVSNPAERLWRSLPEVGFRCLQTECHRWHGENGLEARLLRQWSLGKHAQVS